MGAIFAKSSTYTKDISIKLVTPDSLILTNSKIYDATITLSGKGADLVKIGSLDESKPLEVLVDYNISVLTSNEIKSCLSKKISNSKVKIVEIDFTPTHLSLDKKISKTVPIKSNINVSFSKLHNLKKEIEIIPNTVKITGPKSYVEEVNEWHTIKKTYDNISKSIEDDVDLIEPQKPFIKLNHSKTKIDIEVEEVSEKKLMIPIKTLDKKIINSRIVPQKVEITFLVGLSKFENINEDSFSAVIDIDTTQKNNYPVTILKKPKYIKIQNIKPRYVQVYNLDL